MNRYERQSFLGRDAQGIFAATPVAVVGVGGGGSHIVQQLSHIGFRNINLFDPDVIEEKNLNRLVGGTLRDVELKRLKTSIATRIVRGLQKGAKVRGFAKRWQENREALRQCNLIFSCLDSFIARREIEAFARRFLIPLIDIGIDVHPQKPGPPSLAGQIILSMPGCPCMQCVGFLNEQTLTTEAQAYAAAGGKPQVVWPNGIVASTAIGIAVDLLTDWTKSLRGTVYLSYDGNRGTIVSNNRMQFAPKECEHYRLSDAGAAVLKIV
jgi:hypothetical protein